MMEANMVIGIPRAFLYYKYRYLWETFFDELGIDYILSPETNKKILDTGNEYAISEACLSSKIYLGHVASLIGKCDYILVPRIEEFLGRGKVCTKFMAIYDLVMNTFRDDNLKLLYYNIDAKSTEFEFNSFWKMGRFLGKKRRSCARAYLLAKQAQWHSHMTAIREQEARMQQPGLKILLVAHPYNIYDKYIGKPITDYLSSLGAVPIMADAVNRKEALTACDRISDLIPWVYNRELVGAVELYRKRVDGIILLSSFPCGPDSLINEIILRRVKDVPILNLIIDGQEGTAGIETRLESFADILKLKKEDWSFNEQRQHR